MNEWFKKNKIVIFVAVALAGFLVYAYKTDFSFSRQIKDNNYVPGKADQQTQPPPSAPPPAQPWTPPVPKVSEEQWRSQFEKERNE